MEKIFTLIEFKDDLVVLRDDSTDDSFLWPKKNLPENIKIGDKLNFLISLDDFEIAKKKQATKDILNEILSV